MTNKPANRPSITRKTTPKSEKNRKAEVEQGVRIKLNGKIYELRVGDLTALDAQAMRKQVGMSFFGVMNTIQEDPDLDLIAGIVWMSRRVNGERTLKYEEVASEISYLTEIEAVDASEPNVVDGEVVEGDPEA